MDRFVVVSTDGHAGLPSGGYREYLDPEFREDYEAELEASAAMFEMMEQRMQLHEFNQKWRAHPDVVSHLSGAWDSGKRNEVCDSEGIAAEVLFPDGITEQNSPPFGADLSMKPKYTEEEQKKQWAGARAHNRWMAEFCQEEPDRRVGLAIVLPFYDVDAAVAECKWAVENGLKGILIPPLMGTHPSYNHPRYYPIWEFCQEHGLVVHTHSGPADDYDFSLPGAVGAFMVEFAWWPTRPLWFMIFGGVFELFPRLKFALTEVSEFWIPSLLEMMDVRASVKHTSGKLGDFRSNLTMKPSEYFARNVWVSASALFDEGSMAVRHDIGMDRVMWGNDYPHPEGSWPRTHEKLTKYMKGAPMDELDVMLGTNAITCYDLDIEKLKPIAERIGLPRADLEADAA